MTSTPPWLKSMEHGTLGEARARAFLLNRFWVLESSVDIHGTDYLIQRRLLDRHFLDIDPPRLGIVQVKFIQDGNTQIAIPKRYITNGKVTFEEFFLLVFTGHETDERSYLLSARDV